MKLLAYVMTDIIHLIKIILLCNMFFIFKRREGKHKKIILTMIAIVMSCVSIFIYFYDNKFLGMLAYAIAMIISACVLYQEKILNMIMSAVWIIFDISMIDIMSTILFNTTMDLVGIKNDSMLKVGAAIISLFIVFIVGKIYSQNYDKGINAVGTINLFLFTILAVIDTFIVMVIAYVLINQVPEVYRVLCSIAFILVILGIFVQLGAVILLFMQRNVYKEKKQITEKYLNDQISHYEYLEKREIETKKFRHDLRNHMQMLSNMAKDHQYDKFDRYLEKIDIKIESFGNIITVQNGIVDAIINQYYSKAIQNNIKMEVKGRFPEDCAMDAYDLCTIFSNVLSNALEAATETEEKLITVDCRYTDKNIIVVVKNSFNNVGQFGNGQIKTRKEDVDYHGYGLENIKDSMEKYNGVLDIDINNNMFILTLLFNYIEKRDYEDSNYR